MTATTTIEPTALKIAWERFTAATDEAGAALRRSAFSNVIRESRDFSYSLFDRQGRPLAQSTESIPSFMGTLPQTVRHFLARFPLDWWQPGHVVLTNDPWIGTGHLPDMCVARPIFVGGSLVGFAGAVGHVSDIGGVGMSATARELYHEGLIIPPMAAYLSDQPQPLITELLVANVRTPSEVLGDLEALVIGCRVLERRVTSIVDDLDSVTLDDLATALEARSEHAMRAAIAELPLTRPVEREVLMDGQEETLPIRVTLRKTGTDLELDFEGTSPQVGYAINSVLTYTRAYSLYALKCALLPTLPSNDGAFRPVTITAPRGSLVNPERPAPVGGRNMTGHFVAQAVLGALAEAVPDRVLAESGAPRPVITMRGTLPGGAAFSTVFFLMGGMGAGAMHDGLTVTAFPTNTSFSPIEMTEQTIPVRVVRKTLRADSGGQGHYRGGLGQTIELLLAGSAPAEISIIGNRGRHPAAGLGGGLHGATCHAFINGHSVDLMSSHTINPGDLIRVETPGGGGFGAPITRDRASIERDLKYGYISSWGSSVSPA